MSSFRAVDDDDDDDDDDEDEEEDDDEEDVSFALLVDVLLARAKKLALLFSSVLLPLLFTEPFIEADCGVKCGAFDWLLFNIRLGSMNELYICCIDIWGCWCGCGCCWCW